MRSTRQIESIQATEKSRDDIEQLSTKQRRPLDRLFEKTTPLKQPNRHPAHKDTYISDIINVQSLLNIRATEFLQRKRPTSKSFEDRVIINVCGDRYETHRTTLELYPDTLLGHHKRRKYYYDQIRNEYFFDRNRACFEAILYYYQSHGRLRRPNYVPIDIFLEEVNFFQLGKEALDQLHQDENIKEVKRVHLPKNRFRRYLWATLEYPEYSIAARIVNIFSLLTILVSILSLAVESLPEYQNKGQINCYNNPHALTTNNSNATIHAVRICPKYFASPFEIIHTVCAGVFTIELLLRIISAPSVITYVKNVMNWIDILSVVPYYVSLIIHLVGQVNQIYTTVSVGLPFLRILRFVRVFKFYRVFKNIKSLRVLTSTLKQSIPDFFIMIIILALLSFLFGAAAYRAENESNGQAFDSILKATYWGVITITSVGYGDIYPITPVGRIIACLCALCGAATIGMLVSVLVDRYQRVFARKLYINEDMIDFDDYSDDENNDTDSRRSSAQLRRRQAIVDPDARAKDNAAYELDRNTLEIPSADRQDVIANPVSASNSGVHFIIGYVDDDNQQTSRDLLETIRSAVALRQTTDDNIQLSIIADEQQQQQSSTHGVKFRLSLSSENDSDDDNEALTEIVSGCESKGNVLKKFQCPPSPKENSSFEKRV